MAPVLYIVIPCYNEQEVLPITAPQFLAKVKALSAAGKIAEDSRVLFVNDGSRDRTWEIICDFAAVGWSNDIPEIERFMRRSCRYYFKTVEALAAFLEE